MTTLYYPQRNLRARAACRARVDRRALRGGAGQGRLEGAPRPEPGGGRARPSGGRRLGADPGRRHPPLSRAQAPRGGSGRRRGPARRGGIRSLVVLPDRRPAPGVLPGLHAAALHDRSIGGRQGGGEAGGAGARAPQARPRRGAPRGAGLVPRRPLDHRRLRAADAALGAGDAPREARDRPAATALLDRLEADPAVARVLAVHQASAG